MAGERGRRSTPKVTPGSGSPAVLLGFALVLLGSGALVRSADPGSAAAGHAAYASDSLFTGSDACLACHTRVTTPQGEDVSIGFDWRASMMANSARDPYWQAAVRREVLEHPAARAAIEDKCATCHMPMARATAAAAGELGAVFENLPVGGASGPRAELAADGVSCAVCHQIGPEGLGDPSSFSGNFRIAPHASGATRTAYGPFEPDSTLVRLMASATGFEQAEGTHIQSSELCGSCHTLFTHGLDAQGREIAEVPEQMPYLEWLASDFREERSCQDCHMPVVEVEVPVTGVLGAPRPDVSRHVFRGGNFFMLRMLNRYRDELGVEALPQELEAAAARTVAHLRSSAARVEVLEPTMADGRLSFDVRVTNLAGHKLPSAYPSRRAWLHVTVLDGAGRTVFESGRLRPDGSIVGNDSDDDAARWEPHHRTVDRPDQVQVFESLMAHPDGGPTTGLLTAVGYLKDNRLLPRGFDKATAPAAVAVTGDARDDPAFGAGRAVTRYEVPVTPGVGPFRVTAELLYQPIGFRWAMNLEPFDAPETRRFVRWYRAMADASAVDLAADTVAVSPRPGGRSPPR